MFCKWLFFFFDQVLLGSLKHLFNFYDVYKFDSHRFWVLVCLLRQSFFMFSRWSSCSGFTQLSRISLWNNWEYMCVLFGFVVVIYKVYVGKHKSGESKFTVLLMSITITLYGFTTH